jgi:hypothetical protein
MCPKPQSQHAWLQQLVGEWTCQQTITLKPDDTPESCSSKETVRSLGSLWVICEGLAESPEGNVSSIMTLGFDPQQNRYTATFVCSTMTHLWVYENAQFDESANRLVLEADGPSMTGEGMARYRDIIQIESPDRRLLISHMLGDDGKWNQFMRAEYRRAG